MKKDFVFKWRQNYLGFRLVYAVSLFAFAIVLALASVLIAAFAAPSFQVKIAILSVAGGGLFAALCTLGIAYLIENKKCIFVDAEKAWQIIKGVRYEWKWEEITKISSQVKVLKFPKFPMPLVVIKTNKDYMPLEFVREEGRIKMLLQVCTNEKVKEFFADSEK